MHIVIVGGGTAGLATAMELRKLDKGLKITVLEKSRDFGYSPCSLPYLLSGELKEMDIFYVNKKQLSEEDIVILTGAEVAGIDRKTKSVSFRQAGKDKAMVYDRMILATGSHPFMPKVKDLENVLVLRNLQDARRIMASKGKRAIIIGGGLAGIEIAVALKKRKKHVTILEMAERLAPGILDPDTARIVEDHLSRQGIKIVTDCKIDEVSKNQVHCRKRKLAFDILILATGVKANKELAQDAGLKCGWGIVVNSLMRTSDSSIYACGECAEVRHFLTGKLYISRSGVSAVAQAKIVALDITGNKPRAVLHVDSAVSVASGLYFGSTGVTEDFARKRGVKTVSSFYRGKNKASYHPGAKDVMVKLVADNKGRIIGAQALGEVNISDILNTLSLAITSKLTLDNLLKSETCYNPAVASIHHPLTLAAHMCLRKLEHMKGKSG